MRTGMSWLDFKLGFRMLVSNSDAHGRRGLGHGLAIGAGANASRAIKGD
jgi:hypothetical protein